MPTAIDPTISAGSSQLASGSSPSSAELLPPLPPLEDALRLTCFQSWYPRYRKVSPKATVIPIDDIQPDFLDWLEEDGLTVPHSSDDADGDADDDGFASDRSSAPDEDEDEEEAEFKVIPRRFIALDERIRQVMNKYDGRVFPKLNWSAPRVRLLDNDLFYKCFESTHLTMRALSSSTIGCGMDSARDQSPMHDAL